MVGNDCERIAGVGQIPRHNVWGGVDCVGRISDESEVRLNEVAARDEDVADTKNRILLLTVCACADDVEGDW